MFFQSRPSTGRAMLYVLIAAVAWGTGGAAAAILYQSSGLGPIAVSFWRFACGVAVLAAACAWSRPGRRTTGAANPETPARPAPAHWWWRNIAMGAGLAIYQTAYFAGVRYAGLTIATLVTLGTGPLLIALGARHALGERLGRIGAASVGLALAGLLLLVGGGTASPAASRVLGLGCALLSALGYAAVTLLNRRLGQRQPARHPLRRVLAGFAVGAVLLAPVAALEGMLPVASDLPRTLLLLVYLGVVPTAVAYALFFAALVAIRAATASVLALVESVTAAVIGAAWLGEQLTAAAATGAAVLLAAVALLATVERRSVRSGPTAGG